MKPDHPWNLMTCWKSQGFFISRNFSLASWSPFRSEEEVCSRKIINLRLFLQTKRKNTNHVDTIQWSECNRPVIGKYFSEPNWETHPSSARNCCLEALIIWNLFFLESLRSCPSFELQEYSPQALQQWRHGWKPPTPQQWEEVTN